MSRERRSDHGPLVLDRTITVGIEDICRACGERRALVLQMVEYGIIEPQRPDGEPEFHGEALVRTQVAARLMRDLDINLPGAALAIDLLRQLGRL